jgi:flagellar P-ring protein precursor FlgI
MKIFKPLSLLLLSSSLFAQTTLVGELGSFNNNRVNYLYGVGIVTGLAGTGDKSNSTKQLAFNILRPNELGLEQKDFKTKNTAVVTISATLPSYARIGDKINVNVQTLGDAKSIESGTLMLAYLKGQDEEIYASCQGRVSLLNPDVKSNGTVTSGCIVEKDLDFNFNNILTHTFKLHNKNLKNTIKIKNTINKYFDLNIAKTLDSRNIEISKIPTMDNVEMISKILEMEIDFNQKKKVIVNLTSQLMSAEKDIPVKPTTIDTRTFTMTFDSSVKQRAFNIGDKDVGDDVVLNVDKGLMYRKGDNVYLHDILRILKILKVDFQEMYNIVKSLKNNGKFDAEIVEEY